MNSKAKGLRIACGIVILLNIIIVFVPMTRCSLESYSPITYSQFDYIINVTSNTEPYLAEYTTGRFFWMFFFILLPCILSLVAGVWGIVANDRKNFSWTLVCSVLILYIILLISIGSYFPDSSFSLDMAGIWNILITLAAGVLTLISLLLKEEKTAEPVIGDIPQVNEIKQEQVKAQYNIISEAEDNTVNQTMGNPVMSTVQSSPVYSGEKSINPFVNTSEHEKNPFSNPTEASQSTFANQTQASPDSIVGQTEEVFTGEVEPPVNRKTAMIPQYVQSPPRGVLVGLTGMYAGAEIPFVNGMSIRLGRLNNNDLIFDGQQMVSLNHCTIRWDGVSHTFIFKDTSTSGTYVNGSQDCLPQNIEIEIPVGSVIALGDESNTFRLE